MDESKMYEELEKLLKRTQICPSNALAGMQYISDTYGINKKETQRYLDEYTNHLRWFVGGYDGTYDLKDEAQLEEAMIGLLATVSGFVLTYFHPIWGVTLTYLGRSKIRWGPTKPDYIDPAEVIRKTDAYRYFQEKGLEGIEEVLNKRKEGNSCPIMQKRIDLKYLGDLMLSGALLIPEIKQVIAGSPFENYLALGFGSIGVYLIVKNVWRLFKNH